MMPSGMNVKGKTIILTNPNLLNQKNVILQSIGPGGNPIYQQIPISNMSNIAGLRGATIVTGPPGLVKAGEQQKNNQMPALVPTSNLSGNIQGIQGLRQVVVQTSNSQTMPTLTTNNVHIRPMLGNMPQGQLTLIQRPGQQPQLVQTIQQSPQQTIQRAIITQQPQQTIQIQQQPQIVQTSQAGTTAAIQTQRRGLSLSVSFLKVLRALELKDYFNNNIFLFQYLRNFRR